MSGEPSVPAGGSSETSDRYRPGYELVAEQLLNYMAEQNMLPGDRLPTEQGLAQQLGATRNITREAIKVLAAIGRLSVRRGAGIFVAESPGLLADNRLTQFQPTSMEHVLMLLDYRRLIESDTARRAATLATPIEVRAIREHADSSLAAGRSNDAQAFASSDELFHDSVSVAGHNVFLRSSVANIRRLVAQTDVLLFHGDVPGSLEVAGTQHVGIAEAISQGDVDTAAQLMTAHIDTTQRQFEHKIRDRLFNPGNRSAATGAFSPPAPAGPVSRSGTAAHTPPTSARTTVA